MRKTRFNLFSFLRDFFSVVEIRTKLVSVSTLTLATCYVLWRKGFPDVSSFALMWAATLAVDMGTTAFNNYYDYWRGTDRFQDIDEPDKVLIHAGVEPGFAFWSAFWCFTSAVALGLALAFAGHPWVVPAGAACMAIGFLYTGGPFPISRTPFGELFAGGCLGLALFAIACAVWSVPVDFSVIVAALPVAFLVSSILTVNNTCDIEGDREAGRKTFSILVGARCAERAVVALGILALTTGTIAGFFGILPRFAGYTIPVGAIQIILTWCAMRRDGYSHETKGRNMWRILSCLLWFTFSVTAGYVLDFL